jgi:hypothetical protein
MRIGSVRAAKGREQGACASDAEHRRYTYRAEARLSGSRKGLICIVTPNLALGCSMEDPGRTMVEFRHDPEKLARDFESARRQLPGPDYYEVLGWFHEIVRPGTYVEIGVRHGASLARSGSETVCVGVDPDAHIVSKIPPKTRIYKMTSDDFFATQTVQSALGRTSFALAFLDGMHLFEQALLDFVHLERWAGLDSLLLIHDCLPLDAPSSSRIRTSDFYSGDVWKLPQCLRRYRPDLSLALVPTPPTGLCVISGLDPTSTVLSNSYERIVDEFVGLGFDDYAGPGTIPVLGNDPGSIRRYLADLGIQAQDNRK